MTRSFTEHVLDGEVLREEREGVASSAEKPLVYRGERQLTDERRTFLDESVFVSDSGVTGNYPDLRTDSLLQCLSFDINKIF